VYQNVVRQFLPVCLILAQLLFFTGTSSAEETFAGLKFGVGLSLTLDTGKHDRIDTAELDGNKIVRVIKEHNDIPRVLLETHYFFMPKFPIGFLNLEPGEWGWGPFVGIQGGADKAIQAIGGGWMIGFLRKEEKTFPKQRCEVESQKKCNTVETYSKRVCERQEKDACEVKYIEDCSSEPVKVCEKKEKPEDKIACEAEIQAKCKTAFKAKVKDSFNIGIGLMMDPSVKILGDGITENEPLPAGETTVRTKETSQWGVLFMVSYNF